MIKVCHIRGKPNYWQNFKDADRISGSPLLENRNLIYDCWEQYFNTSYIDFKLKIREKVLNYIKQQNIFDTILYNDDQYNTFIKKCIDTDIVLYSQDDDDILYFWPDNITPGLNVYKYSYIDVTHTKRTQFFLNENFIEITPDKIQSNHAIFSKKNDNELIKTIKQYGYIRSHTSLDSYKEHLLENNKQVQYYDYFFTTQFYHLTSLSLWKNIAGVKKTSIEIRKTFFNETEFNKQCIFNIFETYIKFITDFQIPTCLNKPKYNKGVHLMQEFKNLYLQLNNS